jgi:hypothetical protein
LNIWRLVGQVAGVNMVLTVVLFAICGGLSAAFGWVHELLGLGVWWISKGVILALLCAYSAMNIWWAVTDEQGTEVKDYAIFLGIGAVAGLVLVLLLGYWLTNVWVGMAYGAALTLAVLAAMLFIRRRFPAGAGAAVAFVVPVLLVVFFGPAPGTGGGSATSGGSDSSVTRPTTAAESNAYKDLIVGKWTMETTKENVEMGPISTEFQSNGKMTMSQGGVTFSGSYRFSGNDTIVAEMSTPKGGPPETITFEIIKLTRDELVLSDRGRAQTFHRASGSSSGNGDKK